VKFDPCVPYLASLLILVLCATAAAVAWGLGKIGLLFDSPGFLAVSGTALLVLWASWHALGDPLEDPAAISKHVARVRP
jgi:hypothetical protein